MNKKRLVLRLTTIFAVVTVIIASLSCITFAASNSEESEQLQLGASEAETVYWVPKGEVYHLKKTCRALNRSTTIKEGAVAESGKSRVCQICGKGSSRTENGLYQETDGITYLYKDGRVAQDYTGFYQIAEAGQKYYVKKGIVQSGWISDSNKWYYMDSTGIMTCGWKKISGKWYFFDKSGVMQNGWVNDGGKWYYMDSNGSMTHGWQRVSNKWYYLGWPSDSDSGAMRTGWVNEGDSWYYMSPSGHMLTGWIQDGNAWYYLKGSGAMAANEYAGGYWLNANGSWTYPYKATWRKSGNRWWYGDGSGWYAANTVYKIDGVEYSFDAAGWMK